MQLGLKSYPPVSQLKLGCSGEPRDSSVFILHPLFIFISFGYFLGGGITGVINLLISDPHQFSSAQAAALKGPGPAGPRDEGATDSGLPSDVSSLPLEGRVGFRGLKLGSG